MSTGALLDYLSAITVGVVLFAGQAIGVLLLIMGSGGVTPFIAASLPGLASGGEGDLMPYILSRRFGQKAYGKLYGFSFAFYNLGTLIGPLLMGWGFVRFGAYQRVLITFMPLSICAALFVALSARFTVRHGAMHLTSQRAG